MDYAKQYQEYLARANQALEKACETFLPEESEVCRAARYSLLGGGKRIRAVLALAACELSGAAPEKALDYACALEMLRGALTDRTKLLILPYPCNPTGGIMERADLEALAEVLRGTDVLVLSDEIYSELTFGGKRHVSPAAVEGMKERTVVVNGFSKTFSMTGWRMGFACGPAGLMEQITKIHQFAIMCAPTTAQYAAVEALRHGDDAVESMKEEYDMRRRLPRADGGVLRVPLYPIHGAGERGILRAASLRRAGGGCSRDGVRTGRRGLYPRVLLLFHRPYQGSAPQNRAVS